MLHVCFSFISVWFNFPHLDFSSALFHRRTITSALPARAPSLDTTLHVRVPGKPVESTGLDCVIRGGLPPEWPISCNTPACVLICQFNILAECAKDINSLLLMHESAHVQFIFIITFIFPLLCILISNFPSSIRQSSSVTASTTNFKSRPKMPTLLREPAGIRRELHLRRGKPRIKLK